MIVLSVCFDWLFVTIFVCDVIVVCCLIALFACYFVLTLVLGFDVVWVMC